MFALEVDSVKDKTELTQGCDEFSSSILFRRETLTFLLRTVELLSKQKLHTYYEDNPGLVLLQVKVYLSIDL